MRQKDFDNAYDGFLKGLNSNELASVESIDKHRDVIREQFIQLFGVFRHPVKQVRLRKKEGEKNVI